MKWLETGYLLKGDVWRYKVILPQFLAEWDVYAEWERKRTESMAEHLKKGMVLFDIGAEKGWQSAIYAQFVGGENMVLIEPTPEYWPNLKQIWERNNLKTPKACWVGLLGDKNTLKGELAIGKWPKIANGKLFDGLSYKYIHEHGHTTPQMTLDVLVEKTKVIPDAITMDIEGAEMLVLEGAKKTLKEHKPILWVSIHPDLSLKHYGRDESEIHAFLKELGYTSELLDTDHEQHWLFK